MISANELRIGNWVQDEKGKWVEVDEIRHWYFDWAEPIPLTPEILERCGFKKIEDDCWGFEGLKLHYGGTCFYHINSELLVYLESLHQLQNLYYCLCGTELEIKNLVEV